MAVSVGKIAVVKTAKGVNARLTPGGKIAQRHGKNVVRPKGWKFRVTQIKIVNGHTWAKGKSWWMRADFLGQYKKTVAAAVVVTSPVPGYGVNYPYGVIDKRYLAGKHTGEDHAAPVGARVVAVRSGKIIRADWGGAYGNWTWLLADNGRTYVYCHQQRRTITAGDRVKIGQTIGYVGATGNVTG